MIADYHYPGPGWRNALAFLRTLKPEQIISVSEIEGVFYWRDETPEEKKEKTPREDKLRKALEDACVELNNIDSNYDHDEAAHRYNTPCRKCAAAQAVIEINKVLGAVNE